MKSRLPHDTGQSLRLEFESIAGTKRSNSEAAIGTRQYQRLHFFMKIPPTLPVIFDKTLRLAWGFILELFCQMPDIVTVFPLPLRVSTCSHSNQRTLISEKPPS
jgi:hypothetical protein